MWTEGSNKKKANERKRIKARLSQSVPIKTMVRGARRQVKKYEFDL
jgi:hypothetical protein